MLKIVRLLFLLLVIAAQPAAAQTDNPLDPMDTSSPSATYQSFVDAAKRIEAQYMDYIAGKTVAKALALRHSIDRVRRLMDLSTLPPATRLKVGNAAFGYLLDILARLPPFNPADIPGASGRDWGKLPPKWDIPGTEIRIARVETGPRAGEYLFTAESIENLPDYYSIIIHRPRVQPGLYNSFHQEQINFTGPFIPDRWVRQIPKPLQQTFLDTPIWKEIVIVAAILLVLFLMIAWTRFAHRMSKDAGHVGRLAWHLAVPLMLLFLYTLYQKMVAVQVNLFGDFAAGESILSAVVSYAAAAWAAWIACFLVVEAVIASPNIPDNSYDAHLLRLAARLAAVLSSGTILIYGANDIGIPALGLVAGLGVGGFALALASQSTIENLFGGLSIFADRPFRVGDFIHYGGGSGSVETIGPRSSRIRAPDGSLITVPNSDLAKMHITNSSMRNKCLFLHTLNLRCDVSPDIIRTLLHDLQALVDGEDALEKSPGMPRVTLTAIGPLALQVEIRGYVLMSDYGAFLKIQQALILAILERVEAAGDILAVPALQLSSEAAGRKAG